MSDLNTHIPSWAFLIAGLVLALGGGSYWLIVWMLLCLFFVLGLLIPGDAWPKKQSAQFLSYTGLSLFTLILVRTFWLDVYLIPSPSMSPCLLPGDRILVSKSAYGTRFPSQLLDIPLLNIFHKMRYKKKKHIAPDIQTYPRINQDAPSPKYRELLLFHNPQDAIVNIKRCIGLPGDSIQLSSHQLYRNHQKVAEPYVWLGPKEKEKVVFSKVIPFTENTNDSLSLLIPAKGLNIPMNLNTFRQYEKLIRQFEGKSIFSRNGHIFIEGQAVKNYTFSRNYYFVLGDNRNNSMDSRHWGVIPEELIIARAWKIFYSSQGTWFSRFLKGL